MENRRSSNSSRDATGQEIIRRKGSYDNEIRRKRVERVGVFCETWRKKPDEPYRLTPMEEEMVKGLEEKASKAGLDVNVRIVVSSSDPNKAQRYMNDILGAYGQHNIYEYGNSFVKSSPRSQKVLIRHFIYRHFDTRYAIVLNSRGARVSLSHAASVNRNTENRLAACETRVATDKSPIGRH